MGLRSRWGAGAAAVAVGIVFARAGLVPTVQPGAEAVYNKSNLGPGRLVLTWCAFAVLYVVLVRVPSGVRATWLQPVQTLGRRSLDAYMILTFTTILLPVLMGHTLTGVVAMASAVLALGLSYAWVSLRYGRAGSRPVMRPRVEQDTAKAVGDTTQPA